MKTFFSLFLLLMTTNGNTQSWEPQGPGLLPAGYGVYSISIVNENVVWAVAWDRSIIGSIPAGHMIKVLRTIDAGLTWTVYDINEAPGRISFDIAGLNQNQAVITTTSAFSGGQGRGIFKTEDGGDTWTETLSSSAGAVWIRFFNSSEGVAVNATSIVTTSDGGNTWQPVSSNNIPAVQSEEYTLITTGTNSFTTVDNHAWFGTSKGRVFRTKDKGHHWEAFNTSFGESGSIQTVAFKDTLNGIIHNANGGLFLNSFNKTSDGGETWQTFFAIAPPGSWVSGLAHLPSSGNIFVCVADHTTSPNYWGSMYSTNYGNTWQSITDGIHFGATQFYSPSVGWSSVGMVDHDKQSVFYKWNPGTLVAAYEIEESPNILVHPNPFSGWISIENNTPSKFNVFQLLTLEGKLIHSGDFDSQFKINTKDLPKGVYYLKLIIPDYFVVTKKVIKVN